MSGAENLRAGMKLEIDALKAVTRSEFDELRVATMAGIEDLRAGTKSEIDVLKTAVSLDIDDLKAVVMSEVKDLKASIESNHFENINSDNILLIEVRNLKESIRYINRRVADTELDINLLEKST